MLGEPDKTAWGKITPSPRATVRMDKTDKNTTEKLPVGGVGWEEVHCKEGGWNLVGWSGTRGGNRKNPRAHENTCKAIHF